MTCKNCLYFNMCYVLVDNQEEAEVEGAETDCSSFTDRSKYVVREKGEWKNNKDEYPKCTICGYMPQYDPMIDDIYYSNYCPNCGADMRIEEQNRAREGENNG